MARFLLPLLACLLGVRAAPTGSESASIVGLPSGVRGADAEGSEIQEGSILPIPTKELKNASGADIAKAAEKATEIQAAAAAAGSAVEPSAGTLAAKKAMDEAPAGSPERAAAEKMYLQSKAQDAAAAAAGTAAGTWQPPAFGSAPPASASASASAGSESGGSLAPAAPKPAGSEATAPMTGTGKDGDLNYYKPLSGDAAGKAAVGAGLKKDDAKENESLGRWAKDDGHWKWHLSALERAQMATAPGYWAPPAREFRPTKLTTAAPSLEVAGWKDHMGMSIPSSDDHDLKACIAAKAENPELGLTSTVFTSASVRAACRAECLAHPLCVALVYSASGALMKKTTEGMFKAVGFTTSVFLKRENVAEPPTAAKSGSESKSEVAKSGSESESESESEGEVGSMTPEITKNTTKAKKVTKPQLKPKPAFAEDPEEDIVWKLFDGANIPAPATDLHGCNATGATDIRKNVAGKNKCKAECVSQALCVGLVFHRWGTMLKKSAMGMKKREGFRTELIVGRAGNATVAVPVVVLNVTIPPPKPLVWKLHENKNVDGGKTDLFGCKANNGDIRRKPAEIAACKEECEDDDECVGLVVHPWGTMLKKAIKGYESRADGFMLYYIEGREEENAAEEAKAKKAAAPLPVPPGASKLNATEVLEAQESKEADDATFTEGKVPSTASENAERRADRKGKGAEKLRFASLRGMGTQ